MSYIVLFHTILEFNIFLLFMGDERIVAPIPTKSIVIRLGLGAG
jgi:hypothetical protein